MHPKSFGTLEEQAPGLKNRWLAENAFQGRLREKVIVDLLRGLEEALNGVVSMGCLWILLSLAQPVLSVFGVLIDGDLLRKI